MASVFSKTSKRRGLRGLAMHIIFQQGIDAVHSNLMEKHGLGPAHPSAETRKYDFEDNRDGRSLKDTDANATPAIYYPWRPCRPD